MSNGAVLGIISSARAMYVSRESDGVTSGVATIGRVGMIRTSNELRASS